MITTPYTMPDSLLHALSAAVAAARAAASSAAYAGAAAFVAATDGEGTVRPASHKALDAWCTVTAPGLRARLLKDAPEAHAELRFTSLTRQAYEALRARCLESDACPCAEACQCLDHPWRPWDDLDRGPAACEISYRNGTERGFARLALGRAEVTLYEEPVTLAYELIRTARAGNQPRPPLKTCNHPAR
ncbi:hypothetical protein ACIG3E_32730 [Streptomyces sp. NPDC053474]|uniref:hypothetical protein n=1 Tax=Streptomyces sp. NPDC053474 TaxID=3365704 RepID=UPI0037D1E323